ncbi:MAG: tRNA (guanosine(37)-N1)-methyltransferase TrmD [Oscillospiraceae bacterium]
MRIDIATLFVDMCTHVLDHSIIGRARKAEKLKVECHDIRDYTLNKHGRVDDTPYGGGMGMLLQAEPIYRCYQNVCKNLSYKPYIIYMSPQGTVLNQKKALELSKKEHLFLICGHYEGIDQRLIDEIVDEEISIGDYVLTGGELAALTLVDSVGRLCDGVLSDQSCFIEESHYNGLLEYPQYTKPAIWNGRVVPEVLLSGHHANIEKWQKEKSIENTISKRPDMLVGNHYKSKE